MSAFLDQIAHEGRRKDCLAIVDIMRAVTKEEPKMWGAAIVGFGRYTYKYLSGRELEWMITGFSPRKNALTLYLMAGCDRFPEEMKKLGKYKTSKSCLYIKKLADVDVAVLRKLITKSVKLIADQRVHK